MFRKVVLAVLLALLAGCATTYQPNSLTGGFQEVRLNETSYHISFIGNGYTPADRTQRFILRRAAELALENGFRWLRVSPVQTESQTTLGTSSPTSSATVELLREPGSGAADAVIVIRETDKDSGGDISKKARAAWYGYVLKELPPK